MLIGEVGRLTPCLHPPASLPDLVSPRITCKSVGVCYAYSSCSLAGFTVMQAGWMMRCETSNYAARRCLSGRRQMLGCLMAWLLSLGTPGQGAAPDSHLIAVDFENVELRLFIKFVSEVTGRVFLLDDRVRGQISVRFANRIPVDQLHDVLESVLEVKGFASIAAGPITKIVPLGSAKQQGIEVTGSGPVGPGMRR
jgi:hypothetical protein